MGQKIEIEASFFDTSFDHKKLTTLMNSCSLANIEWVSVPPSWIKYAKEFNFKISALIDFPLGLGTTKARVAESIDSINAGATTLDVCISPFYTQTFHMRRISEDIRTLSKMSHDRNTPIRYILSHKNLELKDYVRICSRLCDLGVDQIITHDGMTVDDPLDNIVLAEHLARNLPVKIIPSSLMFEYGHLELLENTKINRIRICASKIERFLSELAYN